VLAVVVVAGLVGGALARKLRVASVTGQILAGVGLGAAGLHMFREADVTALQPVTQFALGLITLVVGGHLNLRRLRNAGMRLGLLLLAEVTLTPLLVYVVAVKLLGASGEVGVLLAALAISTAPATVVAMVAETKAKGVFVKTLMGGVALNNIACVVLFEVARLEVLGNRGLAAPDGWGVVLLPLVQLGMAAAIGVGAGVLLILATRHVIRSEALATASVITVLLASGLAELVDVSQLLSCLFLGVALANFTPEKDEIVESAFVNIRGAIFAVFFTLAGMHLDVAHLGVAGLLAAGVFVARLAGKVLAAGLALRIAGATRGLQKWMGLALTPQAGVAVGLLLLVSEDPALADIGPLVLTVGLAVVTGNELVGPFLLRKALIESGDAGQDRARLIDFLHEENIVTGLTADTKEQAIEQLVDVLIRSNRLDADREELLASVLEREESMSTCFGSGLAVPHGLLPTGSRMVGAMGLSKRGLPFDTPDGVPVHCIVVLATPENERARHLQVLAALARAVTGDRHVRRQLFGAATPAHAYEILHTEEAEDFNYFLEDDGA